MTTPETVPPTVPPTGGPSTPVSLRRRPAVTADELAELGERFEHARPVDIVRWAVERFGHRLVLATSFADAVLVDIAVSVAPDLRVVFLDTGFHFPETWHTLRRAMDRYALDLTVLRPGSDAADVWTHGSAACCAARKVDVLDAHLTDVADAWISGLRRVDDPGRADVPVVEIDRRGLVKINPIAAMGDEEHDAYITAHDVFVNTLRYDGYASIGCWPCTEPSADGRAGRWGGSRTECGLHR